LDTVFTALRAEALAIEPYLFFTSRMEQLGAPSLRHAVLVSYNLKTAKALGIAVPLAPSGRAGELIE
jgi:hypothetical protein